MLEIRDLQITFYDREVEERAVHDFHLKMTAGEKIGIVGESGSGKTMTAWSIGGLSKRKEMDKSGVILFNDTDLLTCSRDALRKIQGSQIGIIFQEPMNSLNPVHRIGKQIEESLLLHTNLTKKERYERTIEVMGAVELRNPEQLYHAYPHELSGGMRQRVMIAAAMVHQPQLLIADEPTTALDVTVQEQILELLDTINQTYGTSILFISHDLSVVRRLCDRVIVMKDGTIVEEGPAGQLFEAPRHAYTQELIDAIPKCNRIPRKLSSKVVLTVESLSVAYEKKSELTCSKISFTLRQGEILGILGESGSGKTTLAKALVGILPAHSGSIIRTSHTIQMIFQDPAMSLNPIRTIGWILEEPLKIKGGFTKRERYDKVIVMLQRVGLEECHVTCLPSQLSGGQRQRVAIALSLMLEPDLIVADEPVSALDVTIQAQIIQLLLSLQKEYGMSVILIAHDLRIVYQMCDTVLVMKDGLVVEQGNIGDVYHNPKTSYMKQLLQAQFD